MVSAANEQLMEDACKIDYLNKVKDTLEHDLNDSIESCEREARAKNELGKAKAKLEEEIKMIRHEKNGVMQINEQLEVLGKKN